MVNGKMLVQCVLVVVLASWGVSAIPLCPSAVSVLWSSNYPSGCDGILNHPEYRYAAINFSDPNLAITNWPMSSDAFADPFPLAGHLAFLITLGNTTTTDTYFTSDDSNGFNFTATYYLYPNGTRVNVNHSSLAGDTEIYMDSAFQNTNKKSSRGYIVVAWTPYYPGQLITGNYIVFSTDTTQLSHFNSNGNPVQCCLDVHYDGNGPTNYVGCQKAVTATGLPLFRMAPWFAVGAINGTRNFLQPILYVLTLNRNMTSVSSNVSDGLWPVEDAVVRHANAAWDAAHNTTVVFTTDSDGQVQFITCLGAQIWIDFPDPEYTMAYQYQVRDNSTRTVVGLPNDNSDDRIPWLNTVLKMNDLRFDARQCSYFTWAYLSQNGALKFALATVMNMTVLQVESLLNLNYGEDQTLDHTVRNVRNYHLDVDENDPYHGKLGYFSSVVMAPDLVQNGSIYQLTTRKAANKDSSRISGAGIQCDSQALTCQVTNSRRAVDDAEYYADKRPSSLILPGGFDFDVSQRPALGDISAGGQVDLDGVEIIDLGGKGARELEEDGTPRCLGSCGPGLKGYYKVKSAGKFTGEDFANALVTMWERKTPGLVLRASNPDQWVLPVKSEEGELNPDRYDQ